MMHLRRVMPIAWVVISLFLISGTVFAQGKSAEAKARHYGIGHPKTTLELPNGKFRKKLEMLSPKAKGKALGWLQGFEFPFEDVESLRVTSKGEISYADTFLPEAAGAPVAEFDTSDYSPISPEDAFKLHSKPGSNNIVFLDFDGHTIESNSAWTDEALVALAFDPSGDDNPATVANFSQDELNRIFEIWHRMAEDFAAFDIDVTTEEPGTFTSTTGHVLFTHTHDANGRSMPSNTGGGVAYVNVFGRYDYVSSYSPAIVYYSNLAIGMEGMPFYNAEAGSHEFGHNAGLSHDGISNGVTYYEGSGTGDVSWAPIMGKNYHGNVTIWSKGEYANANNPEDDLAILAGKFGYVGDDHADSSSGATPLSIDSDGEILVSNPELDPENVLPENKGIIDDRDDQDWFSFTVAAEGNVSITATPAWHAFTREERRGANLDVELALVDENLEIIGVAEPDDDTGATINADVGPGKHYLRIDGVENYVNSDYSDYASTGMYFLEGSINAEVQVDETPPSPGIMSWASAPQASSETTISMVAVDATDDSGSVQYLFSCVVGDSTCVDLNSGWQESPEYAVGGLSPDTYYAFNVKARDAYGNENDASSSMGDTTFTIPENKAPVAVATYTPDPAEITKGKTVSVTLDGSQSYDEDGSIVEWSWKDGSGTLIANEASYTTKIREGDYSYTLTVTDDNGLTDELNISFSVTVAEGGGNSGKAPKK